MGGVKKQPQSSSSPKASKRQKMSPPPIDFGFIGSPLPAAEAKSKWPHRYTSKSKTATVAVKLADGTIEEKEFHQARFHYTKAAVDGVLYDLFDDAYIQASEGEPDFIGKIVEIFETVDKEPYICARWFYRAGDTVIKDQENLIDRRRVFFSDIKDDNPLSCINSKAKINLLTPSMDKVAKEKAKKSCDLYVDMKYQFPHAFLNLTVGELLLDDKNLYATELTQQVKDDENSPLRNGVIETKVGDLAKPEEAFKRSKKTILDLYSGCGAMSSGLTIGATLAKENLATRWAVDFNAYACESLKFNHPNAEVRNEDAEDFLVLLKEWEKLCNEFNLVGSEKVEAEEMDSGNESEVDDDGVVVPSEEYEVEKLLALCYGDPNSLRKTGLHFKVRWKGYGSADDTWEPIDGLSNCKDKIKDFISRGYKNRILPLPGDVDFICGGPPCQGISGFNRFRASEPLKDKKNRQLVVFMDIVEFLKPRFILMENVTDILKFAKGQLTSYAVGRLVSMNYQSRLGIMAAGAYGVPQCRMRFFLWGAASHEVLPQFPLPTHEVMKKGVVINEFKELITRHENETGLLKTVVLGDAISDLPMVRNDAELDEMPYGRAPLTTFQKFIRFKRHDIFGYPDAKKSDPHAVVLYDHRPLKLNDDDYERVCKIPKEKGANFRNLPGLLVGPDKKVTLDPKVQRPLCKSGKPLVPDYAIKFEDGKSVKPFGRLGMDDIVATVVTRAEPHNQVLLHPHDDRVLSVRENARLQGFPDCYKLFGPIKERYMQVGNAVSFAVSIPLGYCLAKAMQGSNSALPPTVPFKFPDCLGDVKSARETTQELI